MVFSSKPQHPCSFYKSEVGCTAAPGLVKCVWKDHKCQDAPTPPPPSPPPSPPPPSPPPPPAAAHFDIGGIYLELASGTLTARSLNKSVPSGSTWGKQNNFSFVGSAKNAPRTGSAMLGDINLRSASPF